jgi:hypothetical protein
MTDSPAARNTENQGRAEESPEKVAHAVCDEVENRKIQIQLELLDFASIPISVYKYFMFQ